MQDKIGEVFEGTVAGVTSFGLFVALDGVYVEGLLHVTELGNDYFHYDKARHEMAGERSGVRYRLGDRLTIKVVRVDLETTKIDFTLVNKINSLDSIVGVDSSIKSSENKPRNGGQKSVKSASKFDAKLEGKSGGNFDGKFGNKPASKVGGTLTLGVKPKSKTSTKTVSKTARKNPAKSTNQTAGKPAKSKKSNKKPNKR